MLYQNANTSMLYQNVNTLLVDNAVCTNLVSSIKLSNAFNSSKLCQPKLTVDSKGHANLLLHYARYTTQTSQKEQLHFEQ